MTEQESEGKKGPILYSSPDELITAFEGSQASINGIERLASGDIRIKYKGYFCGSQDSGSNVAYECKACGGYYHGSAPTTEEGHRYCEGCDTLLDFSTHEV